MHGERAVENRVGPGNDRWGEMGGAVHSQPLQAPNSGQTFG
jgi:hypothetical protein